MCGRALGDCTTRSLSLPLRPRAVAAMGNSIAAAAAASCAVWPCCHSSARTSHEDWAARRVGRRSEIATGLRRATQAYFVPAKKSSLCCSEFDRYYYNAKNYIALTALSTIFSVDANTASCNNQRPPYYMRSMPRARAVCICHPRRRISYSRH